MRILNKTYCLKNLNEQEFEQIHKIQSPISHIEVGKDRIVFASRNEVFIKTRNKTRKLANFSTDVTSVSIHDCFMCIGASDGTVRVFTDYREPVLWNRDYETIVRDIVMYSLQKNEEMRMALCGNDGTVRFYTLMQKNPVHVISLNNSYVSAIVHCGDKLVVASNCIGVYDLKTYELCFEYKHESDITGVLVLDTHKICFSCENRVYVLDTEKESVNSKTIHAGCILKMVFYDNVIYTLAKDGHLKSFTDTLEPISDFYFEGRPRGFAIFDGRSYIAFEDGRIMTTILDMNKSKVAVDKHARDSRKKAYEDIPDYGLVRLVKKRSTNIDRMLETYRYKDALKEIMKETNKNTVYGVLRHINEVKALKIALKDGNEDFVCQFLNFSLFYFKIREFRLILIDCLTIVLAIYNDMLVECNGLALKIKELSKMIDEEVLFQQNLLQTIGFLESFQ